MGRGPKSNRHHRRMLKLFINGEPFYIWMKQGKEIKDISGYYRRKSIILHTSIKLLEADQLDYET